MTPAWSVIRSATGFSDPTDLTLEVLQKLFDDSVDDFVTVLLSAVNWNKKALGCPSVTLSADHLRVDEASFHLLGSLWDNKSLHAASFWTTVNPTQLTILLPDLLVFSFPPGSLCSNNLSSADIELNFSQNGQLISPNLYQASNLSTFTWLPTSLHIIFPLTQLSVITFVGWLSSRGLSVSTINSYLTGIRQAHLTLGHDVPQLRSDIVTQILSGKRIWIPSNHIVNQSDYHFPPPCSDSLRVQSTKTTFLSLISNYFGSCVS